MRYLVLACDYDSTLATNGRVSQATIAALQRVKDSGRRLLLLTGRALSDLLDLCPAPEIFDRIVAENGAVIYDPLTRQDKVLADPPPESLIAALRARRIPIEIGRSLIATSEPHETAVLAAIRDLGLEWHVIFNKGAVMVLPSGVNKASGLRWALAELALSPHNCVGVGDAENDHAFLRLCECAVAVQNAVPAVKQAADFVTTAENGAGVRELVEALVSNDLEELAPRLTRHGIVVGAADGSEARIDAYGENILVAGASGSGKSTFAQGVLERLSAQAYQYCIVDPEGDYSSEEGAVVLGDSRHPPAVTEVLDVLRTPERHVVVNLLGMSLAERPPFFAALLPRLQELRTRVGRPHWLVIDEAHHLLPVTWTPGILTLPRELRGTMMITVHVDHVSPVVLSAVDVLVAVGPNPGAVIKAFCDVTGRPVPTPAAVPQPGEILLWRQREGAPPLVLHAVPPRGEHRRHIRKYAQGELGEDKSFYFRGPGGRLNLRAQNLMLFMQLAEGVDDDTWTHHLHRGDYSQWVREAIKDDELASEVARVEGQQGLSPAESRAQVRAAIERRYTSPA